MWAPGYRMCKPCNDLFRAKKYCPICLVVYRGFEGEMVNCDSCKFWVHAGCDGFGKEELEALAQDKDGSYSCPNCRGERTTTLMLQLLANLQQDSWLEVASALSEDTAPSASLGQLTAQAAPTPPGAPPEQLGSSPRPCLRSPPQAGLKLRISHFQPPGRRTARSSSPSR